MEEIKLKAELRSKVGGKGGLSSARKAKQIPGIVYGGKKPPVSVTVPEKEILRVLKSGSNVVVRLEFPDGADTVILKALQRHVVSEAMTHVDFQRISLTEKIEVRVHIKLTGEAPGVKLHGGIIEHSARELRVRCLPTAIPKEISVDISALEIGSSLHVKDVKVPEGIEILDDGSQMVASVITPKEEAAPAAAVEGVAGAAEPEVIAKGKKEEEGAVTAEKAGEKPAAPEKGKEASKPAAEKK